MENLEDFLSRLKKRFAEIRTPVFFSSGGIDHKVVEYDSEKMTEDDVITFIETAKPACVLIATYTYTPTPDLTFEHADEDFDGSRYKALLKELKPLEGKMFSLELFIQQGSLLLCFPFSLESEELINEFYELEEELEGMQEPYEDDEEEDGEPQVPYKKLTKIEVEQYAQKILDDPDFISIASVGPRREYLMDFYSKELSVRNCREIAAKVEVMLDKYIRNKVQELKASGKKKVEVVSLLGISKGRIDKYY